MKNSLKEKYGESAKRNLQKSYAAFVAEEGKNPDYAYAEAMKSAKAKKAISDTNYGSRSASLYSKGLSSSGYEDLLRSEAERSYDTAKKDAEGAKYSGEFKNVSGYESYLSNYESLQKKISDSVVKELEAGGNFDLESAYKRAIEAGLNEDSAYAAANAGVAKAKSKAFNDAITYAKEKNLSAKSAKKYAESLGLLYGWKNEDLASSIIGRNVFVLDKS